MGIPVVIHKEHGVYVPELIFGNLLTSSNYNDDEKKGTNRILWYCVDYYFLMLHDIFAINFVRTTCYADAVTGGRNGYGAKLANIFSTEFTVETYDSKHNKVYRQTFRDNMRVKEEPDITRCNDDDEEDFTCISFCPDLARFKMDVRNLLMTADPE